MTVAVTPSPSPISRRRERSDPSHAAPLFRGAAAGSFLSPTDERSLLRAVVERQDAKALDELVRSHVPLVRSLARRFEQPGVSDEDLVQEGCMALSVAARKFDLAHDVRFATYARWWVLEALQRYATANASIVRTSRQRNTAVLHARVRRLRTELERDGQLTVSEINLEIGRRLGVSPEAIEALAVYEVSLDLHVGEGSETLGSMLPSDEPRPDEILERSSDARRCSEIIEDALATLSDRERMVIRCRRLVEEPATLEALAKGLNVSRERVRQIEQVALAKIKKSVTVARDLARSVPVVTAPPSHMRNDMPAKTKDTVHAFCEVAGGTHAEAKNALEALATAVGTLLARGDDVKLPGVGTFSVRHTNARAGRNPATGEAIDIPAKKKVIFKADVSLKETIAA